MHGDGGNTALVACVWVLSSSKCNTERLQLSFRCESFADRLLKLKGDESFADLSLRMAKAGIRISPQSIHKWTTGGSVTPENLAAIAKFFDVSPSLLFFGEETARADDVTEDELLLIKARWLIPTRFLKEPDRDVYALAKAYVTKDDRTIVTKLKAALEATKHR